MPFGEVSTFDGVFHREKDSINKCRAAAKPARPLIALEMERERRPGVEAVTTAASRILRSRSGSTA